MAWQGNGMGAAWEGHAMCVNPPLGYCGKKDGKIRISSKLRSKLLSRINDVTG